MPNLCELADVKDWLGIATDKTQADSTLTRLIGAVSTDFLNAIDRPDLTPAADYTDIVRVRQHMLSRPQQSMNWNEWLGKGDVTIGLKHWPLNSITSVEIDGVAISESPDGIEDGWYYDDSTPPEDCNTLIIIGQVYRVGESVVTVNYNAGYDDVPADIEQAAIEAVAFRYRSKDWIGQASKHMQAGETVTFLNVVWPLPVKAVIDRYLEDDELV